MKMSFAVMELGNIINIYKQYFVHMQGWGLRWIIIWPYGTFIVFFHSSILVLREPVWGSAFTETTMETPESKDTKIIRTTWMAFLQFILIYGTIIKHWSHALNSIAPRWEYNVYILCLNDRPKIIQLPI